MASSEKECRDCGRSLPLSEFYAHNQMADGYLNKCKDCVRARVGRHREENLLRIQAYDRKRGGLEHRKAKVREDSKRTRILNPEKDRERIRAYRRKYPERDAARAAVNRAVRRGVLVRPTHCEECGIGKPHAHHDDYGKPLDVRWLCVTCHGKHHRMENEADRQARGRSYDYSGDRT